MTPAEREGQTAARLVALAKAGDLRAFEELVRRYRRRIFALALPEPGPDPCGHPVGLAIVAVWAATLAALAFSLSNQTK